MDFAPYILPETFSGRGVVYGVMMVELEVCPLCTQVMIMEPGRNGHPFPTALQDTFTAQRLRAGWQTQSEVQQGHDYICTACAEAGRATFVCALCEQERPSSEVHDSWGDPVESLCTTCYQTVPAAIWEAKTKQLYERHRWDFE